MSDPEQNARLDFYKAARGIAGVFSASLLAATLFFGMAAREDTQKIENIAKDPVTAETYREAFRKTCKDQIAVFAKTREIDRGAQDRCMNYEATESITKDITNKDALLAVSFFTLMLGSLFGTGSILAHRQVRKEIDKQPKNTPR